MGKRNLIIFLMILSSCQSRFVHYDYSIERSLAAQLSQSGHCEKALSILDRILLNGGSDTKIRVEIANLYFDCNSSHKSAKIYQSLLGTQSAATGHFGLGRVALKNTNPEQAKKHFSLVLRYPNNPHFIGAKNGLAISLDLLSENVEAQKIYRSIINARNATNFEKLSAWNNLALSSIVSGDFKTGAGIFHKLSAAAEKNQTINNNLALMLALQGQDQRALGVYNRSLPSRISQENIQKLKAFRYLTDNSSNSQKQHQKNN